uniref:Uncharacterized protein n=1 Tax=Lygus hesperus TaxID=30085 RepID=A0A0A9W5E0_LYGHE
MSNLARYIFLLLSVPQLLGMLLHPPLNSFLIHQMTPEDIEYVTYKQNIWPDPKMPKIARVINGTREDKDFPDGSRLTTYVYWYIEAFQTKCKSTLKYLLKKGSKLGTQRIFYECYQ